jgi:oligosaccharyltransferase complex subunit alpha (ribophorin I)
MKKSLISFAFVLIFSQLILADSNADLVNVKVERTIDLTSHLVHITNAITVENKASSGAHKSYTFTVEPANAKNIAYVGAHLSGTEDIDKRTLKVSEVSQDSNRGALFKIDFKNDLAAGKSVSFEVELVLFESLKPYPTEIAQHERQLVVYKGNHYYYSLYQTVKQNTIVNLASDKVESFSQLKPTSKSESTITYGPYENTKPFEQDEMYIHYENSAPFLSVTNLLRTIEVSNWGNIAVEETIDLSHSGAKLKGAFSRFDYMRRQGGSASVKSFKTLLPPTAADVYYRDEIGNISTSNLRLPSKSSKVGVAELELRPRFPLFGGWKTHYTIGYNLPVYQYLYNKGNDFVLKMKLIDHIFEDQYVENAVIRIILPEHANNIEFVAPYSVTRKPNEMHYTYLDTVGRPVVVINKKNTVENHIKDFQIKYTFNKTLIVLKPLLVIASLFVIFLIVIILVRIDFSITPKPSEHTKKD